MTGPTGQHIHSECERIASHRGPNIIVPDAAILLLEQALLEVAHRPAG